MRLLLGLVLAAGLLVGCSSSGGGDGDSSGSGTGTASLPAIEEGADERARLDAARARWDAAAIDDYTWSFRRICFCPPLRAEVRVAGGEAVPGSVAVESGRAADLDFTTMDELFAVVETEIDQSDEVTVEYDPATGQVRGFEADRIAEAVDDELSYVVERFLPAEG